MNRSKEFSVGLATLDNAKKKSAQRVGGVTRGGRNKLIKRKLCGANEINLGYPQTRTRVCVRESHVLQTMSLNCN